jgi:membrane associated rhomboid family serine protease
MIPLKDDTPLEVTPVLTVALVLLNVAAFVWQISLDGTAQIGIVSAQVGGVVPYEILSFTDVDLPDVVPPPLTILTAMFLHGGFLHIASNMLFLWIFGNDVEDALGRARFVAFYVVCGVAAALVQVLASAVAGDLFVPVVGASGAIAGVLAAYVALFPRARVLTLVFLFFFVRLVPLPATLFVGIWFAMQVLAVFLGGAPGVAVFAHLGGFVAGWLLVRILGRRPGWRPGRAAW